MDRCHFIENRKENRETEKKDSCKEARPEGKVDDIQAIDLLVGWWKTQSILPQLTILDHCVQLGHCCKIKKINLHVFDCLHALLLLRLWECVKPCSTNMLDPNQFYFGPQPLNERITSVIAMAAPAELTLPATAYKPTADSQVIKI